MGLFKEHAYAFEQVQKLQQQIYNDACDFGRPYSTKNVPADVKMAIEMIKDLKREPFLVKREEWNGGVSVVLRIGWEIDGGMENGTEYSISVIQHGGRHASLFDKSCDAYMSVDSKPYSIPFKN
jgi:hypothetical protein